MIHHRNFYTIVSVPQIVFLTLLIFSTSNAEFNFDTDNGGEIITRVIVSAILQDVSPRSSDPSLVFRVTTMLSLAWFDAIAPYHPTAIGIYTQHTHRLIEKNYRNRNTAIIYAGYHIGLNHFPRWKKQLDEALTKIGLNPDLDSSDMNTPEGLGIIAAKNVIEKWMKDGMNQLGNKLTKKEDRTYNRLPYFDYTSYSPVNTAYELRDPNRWQPNIVTQKNGIFRVQQFVTPQYGEVTPTSYKSADFYRVPPP